MSAKTRTVKELRALLGRLGLDTTGNRAVLLDRMCSVISDIPPPKRKESSDSDSCDADAEPNGRMSSSDGDAGRQRKTNSDKQINPGRSGTASGAGIEQETPHRQHMPPKSLNAPRALKPSQKRRALANTYLEQQAALAATEYDTELRRQQAQMEAERQHYREREHDLMVKMHQQLDYSARPPHQQERFSTKIVAESMPEFDPDDEHYGSSTLFIARVRSLQEYNGWDDRLTLFAAQLKLRGAAKRWNDASRTLHSSFAEFEQKLMATFPDLHTDVDVQEEMMQTTRRSGENLRSFCHRMVAISQKSVMSEQTVVRYILKRINHREFSVSVINTPIQSLTALYAAVARYQHVFPDEAAASSKPPKNPNATVTSTEKFGAGATPKQVKSEPVVKTAAASENRSAGVDVKSATTCYRCKATGHISRSCPLLKVQCGKCKKYGHSDDTCRVKIATVAVAIEANTKRDVLRKDVLINNVRMEAFLDGGSKRSLIRRSAAAQVEREEPCDPVELGGFGGSKKVVSTTKISPTVKLDGTIFRAEIHVIDDHHLPASLPSVLLGTELLCRDGNRLVIEEGICFVEQKTAAVPAIRADVAEIIAEHPKCFAKTMAELGKCTIAEMNIELNNVNPINRRAYRIPMAKRVVVDQMVDELLEHDIVRPSTSPFSSPVVLVKKANGEDRMCIDYRELNAVTVKQTFPMPVIEEILEATAGNKFFSVLDLKSGYYQLPVAEACRKYTAFVTHRGHYEFLRMPFGLVNAPSVFQRAMNEVQRMLPAGDVLTYLDDTVIPSVTVEEGLQKLKRFLVALEAVGLTLRLDKCVFLANNITFLGHKLSSDGIEPGDKKIKAIECYPLPNDASAVRRFLGLTGFFRKFVNHYAVLVKPLTQLTKTVGNPKFEWTTTQQDAFDELKRRLCSSPVLCLFDAGKRHEVHTDASKIGLAGVLLQEEADGMKPVFYYSRHCTALEQNSPSYELEVLAIVESCERFRVYLIGRHFRIVTDCSAVTTMRMKTPLQPKIARWWLKLLEYDFELVHRPGVQLAYVDAMSRAPHEAAREIEGVAECVMRIDVNESDWLATMQMQDPKLKRIVAVLNGLCPADDATQIKANYELDGSRLFRMVNGERKWVVPGAVRWRMLKSAHDDRGHFGLEKTLQHLAQRFWFVRMRNYTKSYLAACIECSFNKRPGGITEGRLHVSEAIPIPFRTVHIDHVGPFPKSSRGNVHIVGVADEFSKYIVVKAVKSTNTRAVVALMREISSVFGLPARIVSDRGTAYTSREFAAYCAANDIQHIQNAVRTPRANGQIERINQVIGAFLRTTTENAKTWDTKLPAMQWAINSQINKTTNCSPHDIVFRFSPRDLLENKVMAVLSSTDETAHEVPTPEEIAARIDRTKAQWKERYDRHHSEPKVYNEGDLVLVENCPAANGESRKLEPKYRGPYVIGSVLGCDRYIVQDLEDMQRNQRPFKSVFSSEKIKPWCSLGPEDDSDDDKVDEDATNENELDEARV